MIKFYEDIARVNEITVTKSVGRDFEKLVNLLQRFNLAYKEEQNCIIELEIELKLIELLMSIRSLSDFNEEFKELKYLAKLSDEKMWEFYSKCIEHSDDQGWELYGFT